MANLPNPALVAGLADLAPLYRHVLCDVWGVIHNGQRAYETATHALTRYRDGGGKVMLITNAPRPRRGGDRDARPDGRLADRL